MASGTLLNLPEAGSAWEQDDLLMDLIYIARQCWYVFGYKPKSDIKWSGDDADFVSFVNGLDDGG